MAIDETPVHKRDLRIEPTHGSGGGVKFVVIFLVLAALAVGEFFTVNRMNTCATNSPRSRTSCGMT